MSGFLKATLIFSLAALGAGVGLAYFGLSWCALPLVPLLGLAAGYVGANWQKDDPAKTARNTRNGARTGLIVGVVWLAARFIVAQTGPVAMDVVEICIGVVVIAGALVGGGVGGWSWARHEHEVQTGYKPT